MEHSRAQTAPVIQRSPGSQAPLVQQTIPSVPHSEPPCPPAAGPQVPLPPPWPESPPAPPFALPPVPVIPPLPVVPPVPSLPPLPVVPPLAELPPLPVPTMHPDIDGSTMPPHAQVPVLSSQTKASV